ncbi:MAG: hypothetical protein CMF71_03130 [Magnetovibrio sp.]|nr:hypothetical protein [Magnetovibrio sp.]MBH89212.1 hypothetical protein [Magnetovibrio sp.]|tara:strand:+ start:107 stop:505 length:399 start_codon:yes stop_codon:yes gene_type:complete
MDLNERRSLLVCIRNPDIKLDYVTSITGQLTNSRLGGSSFVNLNYVPDKTTLKPDSFGRYLGAIGDLEWGTLEEVAVAVINDVNNELVARWLQLSISAPNHAHYGIDRHEVMLEDRQPNWDNKGLLSRLKLV